MFQMDNDDLLNVTLKGTTRDQRSRFFKEKQLKKFATSDAKQSAGFKNSGKLEKQLQLLAQQKLMLQRKQKKMKTQQVLHGERHKRMCDLDLVIETSDLIDRIGRDNAAIESILETEFAQTKARILEQKKAEDAKNDTRRLHRQQHLFLVELTKRTRAVESNMDNQERCVENKLQRGVRNERMAMAKKHKKEKSPKLRERALCQKSKRDSTERKEKERKMCRKMKMFDNDQVTNGDRFERTVSKQRAQLQALLDEEERKAVLEYQLQCALIEKQQVLQQKVQQQRQKMSMNHKHDYLESLKQFVPTKDQSEVQEKQEKTIFHKMRAPKVPKKLFKQEKKHNEKKQALQKKKKEKTRVRRGSRLEKMNLLDLEGEVLAMKDLVKLEMKRQDLALEQDLDDHYQRMRDFEEYEEEEEEQRRRRYDDDGEAQVAMLLQYRYSCYSDSDDDCYSNSYDNCYYCNNYSDSD